MAQGERRSCRARALHYDYNDNCQRQRRVRRRQEDKETTTTGVATTMVCPRVCDYHHEHLEEEERLTTMVTSTGESAQGEGCHYDTMTGSTAMVTIMQDRLQERSSVKRPTMSSDYIIRLTDRLQSLRSKCVRFFSQQNMFFRVAQHAFSAKPWQHIPSFFSGASLSAGHVSNAVVVSKCNVKCTMLLELKDLSIM